MPAPRPLTVAGSRAAAAATARANGHAFGGEPIWDADQLGARTACARCGAGLYVYDDARDPRPHGPALRRTCGGILRERYQRAAEQLVRSAQDLVALERLASDAPIDEIERQLDRVTRDHTDLCAAVSRLAGAP